MGGPGQEGATRAKNLLRYRGAEIAARDDQMHAALGETRDIMNKTMPVADQLDFYDRMERGQAQATPQLDRVAKVIRGLSDAQAGELANKGLLPNYIQNYMGHIWADFNKASNFYAKRPLEGDTGWRKQRTFPTQADGIAAGLTPLYTNPIDAVMARLHSVNKFLSAHDVFDSLEKDGMLHERKASDPVSDGDAKIDDRISRIYARPSRPGAVQEWKRFDAPEAVASVINNYTDPGFLGHPGAMPLRVAMGVGNVMNMVNLGLSGFHAVTTTGNSIIGSVANGLRDLRAGEVGRGLVSIASAPVAPIRDILTGSKISQEWKNPGSTDAKTAQLVSLMKQGGGRNNRDVTYNTGFYRSFKNALDTGNYIGAALRAPAAVFDAAMKPLMEYYVPAMKRGAFAQDVLRSVRDIPEGPSANDIASAAGNSWDSIDNRFGQVVYDNMFWNKSLKQAAQLLTRSAGWNIGTVRELGGGIADIARERALSSRLRASRLYHCPAGHGIRCRRIGVQADI